jgi:hypothetical protein
LEAYERRELVWDLEEDWRDEVGDIDRDTYRDIDDAFEELVEAVFGSTDFEGEVLTVDLPLDDGKMFFPLGTSAGWPNEVGDIDILFRVPEGKDLEIDDTEDAYLNGYHWYLFQMELANPGFDLESKVMEGDEDRRAEAARADWIYGNARTLGYLFSLIVILILWFGFAFVLRRTYQIKGRVGRDPVLWAMLGLSVLISIPGALLVYFMIRPIKGGEIRERLETVTPIAMYPAAVVMFILAVVL